MIDSCAETLYAVVINAEEQFSVWPLLLDIPRGWRLHGTTGSRAECLTVIADSWTDLTPKSARRR